MGGVFFCPPRELGDAHIFEGGAGGVLLPLREKVSAQPTDEGSRWRLLGSGSGLAREGHQPLIRPASQATFSRKGRRTCWAYSTRQVISEKCAFPCPREGEGNFMRTL